jgi:phosphohistidine phosphatase SixA
MLMIRNIFLACSFALGAIVTVLAPAAAQQLEGAALFAALERGGYTIYLRHSITDLSQNDSSPIVVGDCTTQRNLSEQGRAQARAIGQAFKAMRIRVGSVVSSSYCRTRDTATLAFGSAEPFAALYYSLSLPKAAATKAAAELRQALSRAPAPGTNAVMVGHVSNARDVAGVWPKTEGGGIVLEPVANGFHVIGTFTAAELLQAAGQSGLGSR